MPVGKALSVATMGVLLQLVGGWIPSASAQVQDDKGLEISVLFGVTKTPRSFAESFAQTLELGGFGFVQVLDTPNARPLVGVNVAGHISPRVLLFTELSYNDLGESRLSARFELSPVIDIRFQPSLVEWTSGARIQLPTPGRRIRPYVAVGAGLVRSRQTAKGGVFLSSSEVTHDFTAHLGAGARLFARGRFGVGPEFRVARIPDHTLYRVLVSAVVRSQNY